MHRIHLRGPWNCRRIALANGTPVSEADSRAFAVRLPCTWESALGEFAGRAVFSRKFNIPSNLDTREQVWLVVEGFSHRPVARLGNNSIELESDQPGHWSAEITPYLRPSNLLELELDAASDMSGVVALEMCPG